MGVGRGRGRWWGALAAIGLGAGACSQAASSSHHPGDDVTTDVDATAQAPQSGPDAAYDDGFFSDPDGPYSSGYGMSDAYASLTICPPPDASASSSSDGAAASDATSYAHSDASSDASGGGTAYGSGGISASCTPIPAACVATPNCICFLDALKASLPCTYPHCDDAMGAGFPIYCP
jgi:hypothetical protein